MKYLFCFDTETGDLSPQKGDLLTLYGCILDENSRLIDEIDLYMKPDDGRLPLANPGALEANGIDLKLHFEDPKTISYKEASEKLKLFLLKYREKGKYSNIRPLAYNIDFDLGFIHQYLIPKEQWEKIISYNTIDPKNYVNFLKDCGWFPPDLGTLTSVAKFLNVPMREAHVAKDDVLMMVDTYKAIVSLMKSKKDGGQSIDIVSLLEAE